MIIKIEFTDRAESETLRCEVDKVLSRLITYCVDFSSVIQVNNLEDVVSLIEWIDSAADDFTLFGKLLDFAKIEVIAE